MASERAPRWPSAARRSTAGSGSGGARGCESCWRSTRCCGAGARRWGRSTGASGGRAGAQDLPEAADGWHLRTTSCRRGRLCGQRANFAGAARRLPQREDAEGERAAHEPGEPSVPGSWSSTPGAPSWLCRGSAGRRVQLPSARPLPICKLLGRCCCTVLRPGLTMLLEWCRGGNVRVSASRRRGRLSPRSRIAHS